MKISLTPHVYGKLAMLAFAVLFSFTLNARDIQTGQTKTDLKVTVNTYENMAFTQSLGLISTMKVNTEAGAFTRLVVPGYTSSDRIGAPAMPMQRKLIEFPMGATPEVNILSFKVEEFDLYDMGIEAPVMPAQPPAPKDGSYVPFELDETIYDRDEFIGAELVSVEVLGMMRGLRIARLDIAPVQYNPVSGILRVYSEIVAEVVFSGADVAATLEQKKLNDAPYFRSAGKGLINYKADHSANRDTITKYPVKYVIVADRMFEAQLQDFIAWKTKKGFTVVEAYTDEAAVGNTTTSIRNYLQGLYNAGTPSDPAPSFVLFVGDVAQIPAWSGNAGWHVTDLMYVEYTNDYFPEVYYGRWSASNTSELQPQIDKTLQYEQYTMPDPSYLDEVVMVAGMDSGHGNDWGNGQINYGTENYFNAAHGLTSHTYLYPNSGSQSAAIIQNISDGISFGNYTAHCSASGWADPSFIISDIPTLQNQDEYCVLIGNCCSSNEFDNYCFGEAMLRAENKGAVGYIGGTNSTYWDEDFYFGVGVGAITEDPPAYEETTLGNYDRAFHDHGEAWEDWYTTTYQHIFAGNLAVTEGSPSSAEYYWEIYSVMGDPSLECYYGVPDPNTVSYEPLMPLGSTSFVVNADPYSYVAISMDGVLHGTALADASGIANITLDPIQTPGDADVVVTRQNREPYIGTVLVNNPAGAFITLSSFNINDPAGNNNGLADYGESITLDVELENLGAADADNVEATLSSTDEFITITDATAQWGSIAAGALSTQTDAFGFDVDAMIPDQHLALFELEITGDGKETWTASFSITLNAPVLGTGMILVDDSQSGNGNGRLDPGETADIIVPLLNEGHCDAINTMAYLSSTSSDVVINTGSASLGSLPASGSQDAAFNITVDDGINPGTSISFDFEAEADGYTVETDFFFVAGQIPVLLIDMDPNTSSGTEMEDCLTNLSVGGDYATSIPDELETYASVFVCLGIYSTNYVLSTVEGQALADYLNGGGNLYMEGGDTWYYDQQTPVHSLFGINGTEDGTDDLGTLLGQSGTFTEGMSFTYSGENNYIDHISPTGSAFTIFSNQSPNYGTAVANIGSTYRSIGSSHEFGGLDDGDYSKDFLMYKYLEFFGIDATYVGLEELGLSSASVSVYPNPANGRSRIIFTTHRAGNISLEIINNYGQKVLTLAENTRAEAGEHSFEFDAASFPAGIYHCVITSGDDRISKKIAIIHQ